MKHTFRHRWWLLFPLLLVLALAGFVAWATIIPAPMPEALAALQSDGQVRVERGPWLAFRPADGESVAGLVIYPGGRVDARAYAPAARALAKEGFLVVITPMPLNLAVLASGRAAQVIAAYPQVRHWAVGGHSLGGAMAAQFAYQHPDQVAGLVLWASYPAGSANLSRRALKVVSIYGTRDGLATLDKIESSRALLPAETVWVAIEGGNHAQFGYYGSQSGDNPATISRDEQQAQIVRATLALMRSLK